MFAKYGVKDGIIIARVSSKKQEEGYSTDAQVSGLKERLIAEGVNIIKIYILSESGWKKRVQFEKITKEIIERKGEGPLLVATDAVDRFQRRHKEIIVFEELMDQNKVVLFFKKEALLLHQKSPPSDKLNWEMMVVFAKYYVANLSMEVKKGLYEKAEQGYWGFLPPVGYVIFHDGKDKTLKLDPLKSFQVKDLFLRYVSGQYSLQDIGKTAQRYELVSSNSNSNAASHAQRILSNPFYHGYFRVKEVLYKHNYESIVSAEIFEECQKIMRQRSTKTLVTNKHLYAYKNMLRCGECDHALTGYHSLGRHKKGYYTYYFCSNRACSKKGVHYKGSQMHAQAILLLKSLTISPELKERLLIQLRKALGDNARTIIEERQYLEKQREKIVNRKGKIYLDKLDGVIDEATFVMLRSKFDNEIMEIDLQYTKLDSTTDKVFEHIQYVINFTQNIGEIYEFANEEEKFKLARVFFEQDSSNPEKPALLLASPFNLIASVGNGGGKVTEFEPLILIMISIDWALVASRITHFSA